MEEYATNIFRTLAEDSTLRQGVAEESTGTTAAKRGAPPGRRSLGETTTT